MGVVSSTGTSSGPSVWHGNGNREAAEVTGAGGVSMGLDGDVESNVFARTQEVTSAPGYVGFTKWVLGSEGHL